MKAIVITKENQSSIATQYRIDLDDMDIFLPVGFVLVAEFGSETYLGVVEKSLFDAAFATGASLENDYFEATPI